MSRDLVIEPDDAQQARQWCRRTADFAGIFREEFGSVLGVELADRLTLEYVRWLLGPALSGGSDAVDRMAAAAEAMVRTISGEGTEDE